jgi:hypothetical protein
MFIAAGTYSYHSAFKGYRTQKTTGAAKQSESCSRVTEIIAANLKPVYQPSLFEDSQINV